MRKYLRDPIIQLTACLLNYGSVTLTRWTIENDFISLGKGLMETIWQTHTREQNLCSFHQHVCAIQDLAICHQVN